MIFDDTIESVLSNDLAYLEFCDSLEKNTDMSFIEEEIYMTSLYSDMSIGFDEDLYEAADIIDTGLQSFDDAYTSIISDEIGSIIDIVSGV